MIKTFDLEINGMTNSAMAVDNNDNVSIGKLLEIERVSIESIKDAIKWRWQNYIMSITLHQNGMKVVREI